MLFAWPTIKKKKKKKKGHNQITALIYDMETFLPYAKQHKEASTTKARQTDRQRDT